MATLECLRRTAGNWWRFALPFLIVVAIVIFPQIRSRSFSAERWKNPEHVEDRWRMITDMRRTLDRQRPSRQETLHLLGSAYASVNPNSIRYFLGYRTGGFMPSDPIPGCVTIYFAPDGTYDGAVVDMSEL